MSSEYIGWPTHVNRIILADTTISVGKEATVSESLKSGRKRSELAGSYCPDVFSVVMDFEADDNVEGQDRTEHQIFTDWFKYRAKYGTIPFEFPKIVYTPGKGYHTLHGVMGAYKISSAAEMGKSGTCQRVRMTWEEVYSGAISVANEENIVASVPEITAEYVDVLFSSIGNEAPVKEDFSISDTVDGEKSEIDITAFCFDGSYTVRLWYNALTPGEHHYFSIRYPDVNTVVATPDIDLEDE